MITYNEAKKIQKLVKEELNIELCFAYTKIDQLVLWDKESES